jgi:hypothetical protein
MDPNKGYNLTEGGSHGKLSEIAKKNMSKSHIEKWEKDQEYREKQLNERKNRSQNQDWVDYMTYNNQQMTKQPKYQEKMSNKLKEKWKEKEYSNSVSTGISNQWQNKEYLEKQLSARVKGGKKIPDKEQFLKDIQEMNKKDINKKYGIDGKTTNRKIYKMLGHQGVWTFLLK